MKLICTFLATICCFAFNLNQPAIVFETSKADRMAPPPLDCGTPTSNVEKVVCLANTFKGLLTSTQIASLEIALTTTSQAKWSNLPGGVSNRNGLEYSTLTTAQLDAAKAVVAAAAGTTADEGYAEFSQIRAADTYLSTQGGGSGYNETKYIIAFLGTPSLTGKWMLQFGGHHYAQNITFNAGKVIGTTPSHQGVEPLTFTNTSGTFTPLKSEQAGLVAMLASLTSTQLASAKISSTYNDVVLGPGKDGQFPTTKAGIACSTLTAAQKTLVIAAMKPWTQDADNASGAILQALYEKELDNTYISYSGNPTLASNADYARIDGPSVWIELICQSGVVLSGIHYHSIYRDHTRDYGASGGLTGTKEIVTAALQFQLGNNFPSPFRNTTTIPFTLTTDAHVQIKIYDMLGRQITEVINQNMNKGEQNVVFNNNLNLSQGAYIYQITIENTNGRFIQSKQLMVN